MPDFDQTPLPPFEPVTLRDFVEAMAQVLVISLLGIALAAVIRIPFCPEQEPVHACQR